MMKHAVTLILAVAVCVAPVAVATPDSFEGYAKTKQRMPVRLKLVSPLKGRNRAIEYHAGWPLTFKIIARDEVSLVVPSIPGGPASEWPEPGATSFLMLKDLDDCPSAGGRVTGPDGMPFCPDVPDDELWIEFTPDEDFPDVVDMHGFEDLRENLKDSSHRPTIHYKGQPHTFGPRVHDTLDGLGYGANDDLTGFVLLANTGVSNIFSDLESIDTGGGVVITAGWEPLEPAQNRNLAGFMTSVGYELNDKKKRTTITTGLTVPRHLTERQYLEDQCFVNAQGNCEVVRRVEGGSIRPKGAVSIDDYSVTLRAFVVQGVAPTVVTDCNGNGRVNAADAVCMGYELLSNEVRTTIRQIGRADECNLLLDPWGSSDSAGQAFVDFDGNGDLISVSCPGGSTGGGNPPRE